MKRLLIFAAAISFVAVNCMPVSASVIAWQTSVDMYQGSTVETFVDTSGALAVAYNNTLDAANGNVTVNGVSFSQALTGSTLTGATGETITINGGTDNGTAFGDGEFTSNAAIFHLIRGATFNVSSITLGGLVVGDDYMIQVFNNDARGSRNSNFITGYGDGSGSGSPVGFSSLNNSPAGPTVGDSIIGTFTAMAASQNFTIYGTNGGAGGTFSSGNSQSQINAIQLRNITTPVPEPGSAIVLGLLGLAGLRRRR